MHSLIDEYSGTKLGMDKMLSLPWMGVFSCRAGWDGWLGGDGENVMATWIFGSPLEEIDAQSVFGEDTRSVGIRVSSVLASFDIREWPRKK